jgi:hypothetical protein
MLTIAPSSNAEIPEEFHDVGTLREGGSPRALFFEVFS